MAKLLIRFNDNWADEMDISGLFILEEAAWIKIQDRVKKIIKLCGVWDCGIGTNENIEYDSFEQWLHSYTVVPITDEDANVLVKTLGKVGIKGRTWDDIEFLLLEGHDSFPWQDQVDTAIEENGDEDDEDDDEEEEDDE